MAEMTASEAAYYLRYGQVNNQKHDMRSQYAADLIEQQAQEIAKLKDEILRCRTKDVRMDGTTYGTINASQVFRLHEMVRKEKEAEAADNG